MVAQPSFTSTSNECNQKESCKNGAPFHLYFYSTNGRDTRFVNPYMITVITIPGAEQYFKIEPFNYGRSRAIADPVADFKTNQIWLIDRGPIERQDIWQIRNAKNIEDLRSILKRHSFNSFSR